MKAGTLRRLLPRTLSKKLPREVKIIKASAQKSRELNRKYRKKNKPVNVLSFRYGPEYGEILVCPEIIRREAKKQGNTRKYQMTWMIIHGMLHLAGLHHEKSRVATKRFSILENRLLKQVASQMKIKNPKSKVQNNI